MKWLSMIVLLLMNSGVVAQSLPDAQKAIEAGRAQLPPGFLDNLRSPIQPSTQPEKVTGRHYQILISEAIPESRRELLLKWAATREDVTLVIQGLLPSERTITEAQRRIARWVTNAEVTPNIVLDPRPFEQLGINHVPVLIAKEGTKVIAQVAGITDPNWLEAEISKGKQGNLGQYGSVVIASERNLTAIMKERASRLDMTAMIEKAKANVGKNLKTYALPKASKSQQRIFTPVITANRDVLSPKGEVIRRAGEQINLLAVLPFHKKLVVFDASDAKQLEWAIQQPRQGRLRYLVTGLPDALDAIKELEQKLGAPLYLLTRGVASGFNLRSVPSTVRADNTRKHFVIEEAVL